MQQEFSLSWVQSQVSESVDLWNLSALPSTLNGPTYTRKTQNEREQACDEALQTVERELINVHLSKEGRLETQNRIITTLALFSQSALGLNKEAANLLTYDFLNAGTHFSRLARQFDPTLSMANITQACRSAWTACGLQMLLGDPIEITPAILGYSLLYPYSDNFLDSTNVRAEDKVRFSKRFRKRLVGCGPATLNPRETALWALVDLIEAQFPRTRYPQVYDCLLAIHHAQEASIGQLGDCPDCNGSELLRITCAKGGSSVLADACLAHGSLSQTESRFSFDWGVLLQLGDDLQDVSEDLARGSHTLFTRAVHAKIPLDAIVLQLLNFSERVAARMDSLPGASKMIKDLLTMSWRSLIVGAVAESHELFSPEFLVNVERLSPFRFDFLRVRHKKLANRQGLYSNLFEALTETGEINEASSLHACNLLHRQAGLKSAPSFVIAG
jgi:hypothetical protein